MDEFFRQLGLIDHTDFVGFPFYGCDGHWFLLGFVFAVFNLTGKINNPTHQKQEICKLIKILIYEGDT